MLKRMLIDSSHPEETRVVVLDGQKVEEFDFEAASKRPLKGNIYLAKVTRVEPSLQAAFVEYGGNRQGFLAFSEIHPDYYQIPVADRLALLAEQEAEARRRSDDEFESFETATAPAQASAVAESEEGEDETHPADEDDETEHHPADEAEHAPSPAALDASNPEQKTASESVADDGEEPAPDAHVDENRPHESAQHSQAAQRPTQRWVRRRHYKIQEVIKRRQVILVQVVKEERGNKGAALTTYLSLAGRYCVLMPNTPRGGGISRKITNANDRKRLKSAAQALELPEGMGLIIRTAGENRTKVEIKRDYEYLLRMWDTVRDITLKSNAPACVYEEGDLIKRAIRDLYNKDVSEIVVEGEDGYRNAKDFMRMLMPSHAKNVKPYKEPIPLFQRMHIEAQLDAMFSPTVTLRSGGYIVINQTEALVAIDVNSGRATREHSIEDTAYKTNLEAAEEIGRQLRLRDLAGLIVIDFIDMEDARNDRNVEKRLRDCIKNDRARIQIGKISQFGLLEMSRQRLRAGVVAGSTVPCPTCSGQGIVRSVESTALRVLRALDEEGQRQRANTLVVNAPVEVAMYTLNQKRREIARMEQDYSISIAFLPKDEMLAGTFELERIGQRTPEEHPRIVPPPMEMPLPIAEPEDGEEAENEEAESEEDVSAQEGEHEHTANAGVPPAEGGGRRRRRRRRRGGRDREPQQGAQQHAGSGQPMAHSDESHDAEDGDEGSDGEEAGEFHAAEHFENGSGAPLPGEGGGRRKRRRRRRRGRGGNGPGMNEGVSADANPHVETTHAPLADLAKTADAVTPNAPSAPVWSLSQDEAYRSAPAQTREHVDAVVEPRPAPVEADIARVEAIVVESAAVAPIETVESLVREPASAEPAGSARKGWWQRPFRLRD